MNWVIATRNKGKVREFAARTASLGIEVTSLLDIPSAPIVEEDGHTFMENAQKKAYQIATALHITTIADDSGICVDALNGEPGIYSARYAGEGASDEENNHKLLAQLSRLVDNNALQTRSFGDVSCLSTARFQCALALYDPIADQWLTSEGAIEGWICNSPRDDGGFGYDPLFYMPDMGMAMSELDISTKNQISHRGIAMDDLIQQYKQLKSF